MSEANSPAPPTGEIQPAPPAPAPPNFTVGSTVVPPSSAEIAFALREDQFQTLCEGEMNTDKASRDLCIGLLAGAVVGFVGVLASTDWETIWKPERRVPFLFWSGFLLVIASGSLIGTIICWKRLYRTGKNSSYARLKSRIEGFFAAEKPPQGH